MEYYKDRIRNFVLENAHGDKQKIDDDTLIFREGFFDSMGFLSLIGFLEESFNVVPEDEDLIDENFESINAVSDYIGAIVKN